MFDSGRITSNCLFVFVIGLSLLAHSATAQENSQWESHLNSGYAAFQRGEFAASLEHYAAALKEAEATGNKDRIARTLRLTARTHVAAGKYPEAEQTYLRAVTAAESLGQQHVEYFSTLNDLGDAYRQWGRLDDAEKWLLRAIENMEKSHGADHPEIASSLNNLGLVNVQRKDYLRAIHLFERAIAIWTKHDPTSGSLSTGYNNLALAQGATGQDEAAQTTYVRAVEIIERGGGNRDPRLAMPLNNLGQLYVKQGKHAEAEPYLLRALSLWEGSVGVDHVNFAAACGNLGGLYFHQGKYVEAERYFRRAAVTYEKRDFVDMPEAANTFINVAESCRRRSGELAECEPAFQHGLELMERNSLGKSAAYGFAVNNYAVMLRDKKEYARALPLGEKALNVLSGALGPYAIDVAVVNQNLGDIHRQLNQDAPSEAYYRAALAIREKVSGPDHSMVAELLNYIGNVLYHQQKYEESEPYYSRAAAIWQKKDQLEDAGTALANLASAQMKRSQPAAAEASFRVAIQLREKHFGVQHAEVLSTVESLIESLEAQHKVDEIIAFRMRVIELNEKLHGAGSVQHANSLNDAGLYLYRQDRNEAAEPLLRRSLQVREKISAGTIHEATSQNNLALALDDLEKHAEAADLFQRAIQLAERVEPDGPGLALFLENYGDHFRDQRKLEEGIPYYDRAASLRLKQLKPDNPALLDIVNKLADAYHQTGNQQKTEAWYRRSFEIAEKGFGAESPRVATALYNLADALDDQERYPEAQPLHLRAIALDEKHYGREHAEVAVDLLGYVRHHRLRGQYDQAAEICRRAVSIREKANGPESSELLDSLRTLAGVQADQKKYADAQKTYARIIQVREKQSGPESKEALEEIASMCDLLQDHGQFAAVEVDRRRILATWEKRATAEPVRFARALNNLGVNLYGQEKFADAEAFFRRALVIFETSAEREELATTTYNLADTLEELNRADEFGELFAKSLAMREQLFGDSAVELLGPLDGVARARTAQRKYAEAEALYRRSLKIEEREYGAESEQVASRLTAIGDILMNQEKPVESLPLYERAVAIRTKSGDTESDAYASLLDDVARAHYGLKDYAKAELAYRTALRASEKANGPEHPTTAVVLNGLARTLDKLKQFAEAEKHHKRALAIDEKALPAGDSGIAADLRNLGRHYLARKMFVDSERHMQRAVAIIEKLPDEGRLASTIFEAYAELLREMKRDAEASAMELRAKSFKAAN